MDSVARIFSPDLLTDARNGDAEVRGRLLESFRSYLSILARVQIGRRIQGKLDASDVVQDTFLDAHRNFDGFQGQTLGELVRWLRQILASRLTDEFRRYLGTKRRDVRLEREIEVELDRSGDLLDHGLVDPQSSPSGHAMRREQALLVTNALSELPKDYRDAIVLRHLEGLSFPQVAERMGKSLNSVEKLWMRGLAELRKRMGGDQ